AAGPSGRSRVKVFLMYPDRHFDASALLPDNEPYLSSDLGLGALLEAMSGGDAFLLAAATHGLHASLASPPDITYRQHVLADCAAQPAVVRDLYDLAVEAGVRGAADRPGTRRPVRADRGLQCRARHRVRGHRR
ncbi:MAG: hypothetical protein ACRDN0_13390, partial [Trebonia sp.]